MRNLNNSKRFTTFIILAVIHVLYGCVIVFKPDADFERLNTVLIGIDALSSFWLLGESIRPAPPRIKKPRPIITEEDNHKEL